MTAIASPAAPGPRLRIQTLLACLLVAGLGLVGLAAVLAPTANAGPGRAVEDSLQIDDLNIYDPYLTQACGFEVVGFVSGLLERKVDLGNGKRVAVSETQTFDGTITWVARASGNTYADRLHSKSRIEYPEGLDLWLPAHVTVTGTNGGTFPGDGGPPGHGTFEYDAQIYAVDGVFAYVFPVGDPTWNGRSFERAPEKVCAALG
jgi:hypothetical protein